MARAKEHIYIFTIKEGDRGDDTEAFIKAAIDHQQILRWAYILHDKDTYNQHDINVRYYGAQRCWADGFLGMEKYASMEEYLDEQIKSPPYIGDKKDEYWYVFLTVDKTCKSEDIADWFGIQMPHMRCLETPASIKNAIQMLTNEDEMSLTMERYHYSDDEVKSNFDFREYMSGIKIKKRWGRFQR